MALWQVWTKSIKFSALKKKTKTIKFEVKILFMKKSKTEFG